MARSGTSSRLREAAAARSEATRGALVEATIEVLVESGYAGASARSIADRANVTQGVVFYHYGSVLGLLLAALDDAVLREDPNLGVVLAEMTMASASDEDLAVEVSRRIHSLTGDTGSSRRWVPMNASQRHAMASRMGEALLSRLERTAELAASRSVELSSL